MGTGASVRRVLCFSFATVGAFAMMLLAIDVGNTTTALAAFSGDDLREQWRLNTDARRTADEYAALLHTLFSKSNMRLEEITDVAISSVVPAAIDALVRFGRKHLGLDPFVLSAGVDFGVRIHYHPVTDVGADRVANAVAAHAKYGGKVIVVDFGTATTLDAVSEEGDYLGGAILPGI
ncbi:MAG: type III pantothenate kinase, partial [Armatimonadota bacterium]|nr:type III pantothenate kinase [Armatimonadota bacterium]